MAQSTIFGPFLAMIVLTGVVWVVMFARRIPFIQSLDPSEVDLRVPGALANASPPAISNPSDNLKNLFEMPVLFYGIALYLFVANQVDGTHVAAAWVFFGFRALHSLVHCTFNHVILRFSLYLVSTFALWFMVGRAVLQYAAD